MAGFVAFSTARLAASSAGGIQAQLRKPPLLIAATVTNQTYKSADLRYDRVE